LDVVFGAVLLPVPRDLLRVVVELAQAGEDLVVPAGVAQEARDLVERPLRGRLRAELAAAARAAEEEAEAVVEALPAEDAVVEEGGAWTGEPGAWRGEADAGDGGVTLADVRPGLRRRWPLPHEAVREEIEARRVEAQGSQRPAFGMRRRGQGSLGNPLGGMGHPGLSGGGF
jgi:hypothetical protein